MAPVRPSKAAQPAPPARAPQPKRPPAPVSAIAALQSRVGNAGLQQLLAQRADASSAKGPLAPGPTASASAPIMGAAATAKTPPASASGAPAAPAGKTDTIADSAAPAGGGAKAKSGAAAAKAGAAPAARAGGGEAGGKAGGPGAVSAAAAHAVMAGTIHAVHARAAGARQLPKRKTLVQAAEAAGTVPALEHRREADRQQVHGVGAAADTIEKVKRDEFKTKLANAIAASMQQPKTEAAADRVMKQGAADANKTLRTQLATQQEATAGPLKTATQQDSPPAQGSAEAPTLARPPIGAPPPPVPAAGAVPAPLPPEQLDYSSDHAPTERAMAENNVAQEQLEEGNEPAFGPALSARSAAEKHEAEAPGRYRQAEGTERDKATGVAQQALSQGLTGMHGARTSRLGKASAQQQDTRDKNLAERKRITDRIAAIKNATLRQVTHTLDAMEHNAVKLFEVGLARAEKAYADTFEEEKGGVGTWLTTWGSDWEKHIEHSLGKAKEAYDKQVTVAIDEVATYVDDQLAAARRLVAQGRAQVDDFVQGLSSEVKQYGEEALQTVGSEFDQMEGEIDRRRDSLVDKLTQQYRASHERMAAMEEKLREENKSLWQRVYDATIGLIKKIVAFAEMLLSVLARAAAVVGDIIRHPIRFLGNLVSAVKLGVTNFAARIGEHLKQGFMEWLFGVVGAAGIELPKSFDLKSILRLVLQLLGLTWPNIRARAVALLGEKVVAALETASEIFTKLVTEGPGALWQWIQDKLDLKGMVFEKIMDFLVQRVIVAGITWIIGLLNPASAFLKACKAIYDIVVFFVERAAQIAALVNAVLDSIAAIVAGGIAGAAAKVEDALARAIPVVIGFLAGLLGLGGLSEKIKSIVEAIRKPINTAIDWVIGKAVTLVKAAGKAIGGLFGKKEDKPGEPVDKAAGESDWWLASAEFTDKAGHPHRVFFKGQGESAVLTVASVEQPMDAFFARVEAVFAADAHARAIGAADLARARAAKQRIDRARATLVRLQKAQPFERIQPEKELRNAEQEMAGALRMLVDLLPENQTVKLSVSVGQFVTIPYMRTERKGEILVISDQRVYYRVDAVSAKLDMPTEEFKAKWGNEIREYVEGSLREKYLGATPGKASATGRAVIARYQNAVPSKFRTTAAGVVEVEWRPGTWHPLLDCDMSHWRVDAVDYWNDTGRHTGPKSDTVRSWMLDANNYILEPSASNRSRGSANNSRYKPPTA